jgi:hypothetical protein
MVVLYSGATINVGSVVAVPTLGAYALPMCFVLLLLMVIRVLNQREILSGSARGLRE